jgi:ParB-like chromosome segregation protein Spo0J
MIKKVKITEVISNPNNPRLIKDDKFRKLVKSIQDFPDMLNVRPIVVNKDMVVLGGNMRLKAIKEAGIKEINVDIVDWNEQQQKEFIVKDNVGYGEWDWDDLANNWDAEELTDWGLDIPNFDNGDYSDKNKEINIDDIEDSMTINLKYTEEEYLIVKEALSKIASTPEMAIWKLIGNE